MARPGGAAVTDDRQALVAEYVAAARAVVSNQLLLTRWPCPGCHRPGPDAPLRTLEVRVTVEDGRALAVDEPVVWTGCWVCNTQPQVVRLAAATNALRDAELADRVVAASGGD